MNIITLTDSYKVSHWKLFPPDTKKVYYYLESRGGEFESTLFFGLQYIIKKYLQGVVVTKEKIDEAEKRFKQHFPQDIFNRAGWEYIVEKHGGCLPLEIKAIPEGVSVPTHNILLSVENTDEECKWLSGYIEPLIVQLWYPITVTTQSGEFKKIIDHYLKVTSDNPDSTFKLHDFGLRGVSSVESAAIGGAAHLVNFKGTDNLPSLDLIADYYGEDDVGYSIPATEHSTITSWGKEGELTAYKNLLEKFPTGTIACVSDSYDIFNACEKLWGGELKSQIENRDGCLVIRPDSGEPAEIVWKCLKILGNQFGFTVNSKGYKVLNPKVRIIQGDGVDLRSVSNILGRLAVYQWSTENVSFGSGGALLQKLNRDTQKFAYKCSSILIGETWRDVFKQPITDQVKISKKGKLKLVKGKTVRVENEGEDELRTVFLNGKLLIDEKFSTIRERNNGSIH